MTETTGDTTTGRAPDTRRTAGPRRRAALVAFRIAMAALILLLSWRTYEETGIALARSNGTLRTAGATVTEMTSHTESGTTGGGQDGGGASYHYTEYTIELRLADGTKTLHGVPEESVHGLREGRRATVGLWHGRVVEIDGRDVWRGWHPQATDITLFVLYPLIMGYLIALAVSAAAFLAGLGGRGRVAPDVRGPAGVFGFFTGVAAILGLVVLGALGEGPVFWPLVPVAAGTAVALARLRADVRRARRAAAAA
ncbi:hypothetical protein JCM4814A_46440 [Streptomyces phaeofaciens JCM 4814]|uniref:Uncharacterized protein n=1 Tax=Streptomyces phaeofaciens TaxID=68254 RepID=A0A918H213_9ACTN|nr:hypothetical protein [Streptomyces phaeofaciens]GGT30591.1 hypothetical protein GCM10010226_03120 [Streptomyces phaeofaciens]